MEMDSFSDFTTFGIAPAMLTWFRCMAAAPAPELIPLVVLGSALMPVSAAIRLARFNTCTHEDPKYFSGVPTTMVAGMFATFVLSLDHVLPGRWNPAAVMPSALILASYLMLSSARIPKLKPQKSRLLQVSMISLLVLLAACAVFQVLPEIPFLVLATYLLVAALRRPRGNPAPDEPRG
jgi:CDP-diacylglycerol--serine O-phosphatidyltransferase